MTNQHVYDNYEISPCRRFEEPDSPGLYYYEVCEPDEADVWTLYGHIDGQGVEAIGDFPSRQTTGEVFYRITGEPFTGSYRACPRLRLMHAAPELLKALERCTTLLADYDEHLGEEGEAYRDAIAAIAKATGSIPPARPLIEITEDEFDARYPLMKNPLNPTASWGADDDGGCLFETYGEELEFVKRQDPHTIWTFVDGDDENQYLLSGFHLVNRIGYLISTVPIVGSADIQVSLPMEAGEDDDLETNAVGEV